MGKITKGFKGVRKLASERGKYIGDCRSCRSFSQEEGETEESCKNNSVTKYDMTEEESRIYCSFWKCEGEEKKDE